MKKTISLLALAAIFASTPLFAHEQHCHLKDASGKLVDSKDIKNEKACKEKGGTWRHHHDHCHKAGTDGKMVDLTDAKSEKDCSAKGGKWSDHGHETNEN